MRFQREAKTVAALNNPNIVTIFSVEEADRIQFLTMELVSGAALDTLLPPTDLELVANRRIVQARRVVPWPRWEMAVRQDSSFPASRDNAGRCGKGQNTAPHLCV